MQIPAGVYSSFALAIRRVLNGANTFEQTARLIHDAVKAIHAIPRQRNVIDGIRKVSSFLRNKLHTSRQFLTTWFS